ncbi:MAG: SIMPL domain-containing protein [Chitinophagaceae bacterium]|nr:SIMPL domain-containing protein [Chitinophagaceae bacterium]MBP8244058.1 SIMPL domain-containing protein [Chitinophagaceae bacterium]
MRKLFVLVLICFGSAALFGQTAPNPFPKTITVSGSAEMEVIPDQIFVNILLREYQKKGEAKKDLETIKTDFLKACANAGIADSLISIVSYTGYNNYYWLHRKKKSPDMNASITYQIRFSQSKQMDELVDKLDDEATQSFDIVGTNHSKMTEFRKQLKIGAVKAAKDKAIYLTDAIGEKLGPAITVNEPDDQDRKSYLANSLISNVQTRYQYNDESKVSGKTIEIDFKKIKLRFEVEVIFALN